MGKDTDMKHKHRLLNYQRRGSGKPTAFRTPRKGIQMKPSELVDQKGGIHMGPHCISAIWK